MIIAMAIWSRRGVVRSVGFTGLALGLDATLFRNLGAAVPTALPRPAGGPIQPASPGTGASDSFTSPVALGSPFGVAFGDFDNDGDVDIVINNASDVPTLLRNDLQNQNRWLKIKTEGTHANRTGIGAYQAAIHLRPDWAEAHDALGYSARRAWTVSTRAARAAGTADARTAAVRMTAAAPINGIGPGSWSCGT